MRTAAFRSFAKINLGLEVVGKLPGGYHELKTLFATLSLHDRVQITETRSGITVRCDHPGVPQDEGNIAHRAAVLMQRISGRRGGVRIEIKKRIAPGGGLGGGSSNAAAVLRALDRMWALGLDPKHLVDAAKTLGADVPYFLVGGPALGLGRGDDIHPLDLPLHHSVLLVQGAGGVSTAAVFQRFVARGSEAPGHSRIDRFLKGRADLRSLRNDLEAAAFEISPPLRNLARRIRGAARKTGAAMALMSGSGSSFFLLFGNAEGRAAAAGLLREMGLPSVRCSFVSRRVFQDRFEER